MWSEYRKRRAMDMFRFDTHVHTKETSHCGQVAAMEMVKLYAQAGYSGFVMTDHYNRFSMERHGCGTPTECIETFLKGYRDAKAYGDSIGFDVLLGMELLVDGSYNEYLLYGLTEEFLYAHPHIFEEDLLSLRRLATENDILIFQAHPYRPAMTRAMPGFLDGVEVFNGNPRADSQNHLALMYANQHNLLKNSGSDAHRPEDVGRGGLLTKERIGDLSALKAVLREGSATLICND
jgi:predicted metal-dependent phosphoesterase TrpH